MKVYRDHFFLKAKQENYPARSVYKLREIDKKFSLLKKGMKVLELGAAPGSWTLLAAEKVGQHGKVVACDLQSTETAFPRNVLYFQSDIYEPTEEYNEALERFRPFQLIMSDMAPQTTGTRFTDQARSLDLCLSALEIAKEQLAPGGAFLVKIFMGPDIDEFLQGLRKTFTKVKSFKPQSSRKESKETFFVALGFKPETKTDTSFETDTEAQAE